MDAKLTIALSTVAALLLIFVGFVLADLPHSYAVCSSDVVSTDLCEPARASRSVVAAALIGGGIIAGGIIVAATVVARALRPAARQP